MLAQQLMSWDKDGSIAAKYMSMANQRTVGLAIDNRLRVRASDLANETVDRLCRAFTYSNPTYHKLRKMGFKAWKEKPMIRMWAYETDNMGIRWLALPRGGSAKLHAILAEERYGWNFTDRRTRGDKELVGWSSPFPEHRVELWEHQERIVKNIMRAKTCVVRSATGSGKTTALLSAISQIQLPTLVVVWETGLLRQWLERIEVELGLAGKDVGMIGSGEFRLRPLTMAMQQTLNRLDSKRWNVVTRAFGFLGADELAKFAANTFQKSIDRFPALYRVGMSAEETRKDGKEFLIYDLFGEVAVDVRPAEMVEAGIVHDVEVRVVLSEFRADWYVSQRNKKTIVPDFNRLLDELQRDKRRNRLIADIVREATSGDRQTLVFAHRVEHCRRLDSLFASQGLRSGTMVGEDPESYVATVEGLRQRTKQVGIGTYGKIGLGLDLPAIAAGVIATPCHNNRPLWVQVTGRLSRTADGKTDAVLWYVWDRHVHGEHPLHNLNRWSRSVKIRNEDGTWIDVADWFNIRRSRSMSL